MTIAAAVFRRDHAAAAAEDYALSSAEYALAVPLLRERHGPSVLLATCARTEAYTFGHPQGIIPSLLATVEAVSGRRLRADDFVLLQNEAAVRHLMRVACGLESAVIGESEILGQVRNAFVQAASAGLLDPVLPRLFHAAVRAGRRARAETRLNQGAVSLASVAVSLAAEELGGLKGKTAIVVGAGEVGRTAARHTVAAGARLVLVNRDSRRASALAAELGVPLRPLDSLPEHLTVADAVFCCTGADRPLLTGAVICSAVQARPAKRVVADLAVPGDVAPEVASAPGVVYHDLVSIQERAVATLEARTEQVERVEQILEEELSRFLGWYRGTRAAPAVAALQRRGDEVRRRALTQTLPRLQLSDAERERVQFMAASIVGQLLAGPIARLKEAPEPEEYARVLTDLFGLEVPEPIVLPGTTNPLIHRGGSGSAETGGQW